MAAPIMTPLELSQRLGLEFSDEETLRVELLISDAQTMLARHLENDFETGTETSEEHNATVSGRVELIRWPVTSVTSVVDVDAVAVDYSIVSDHNAVLLTEPSANVFVTYDYGFDPEAFKGLVSQIVGRAYGTPAHNAGITSETTGPYNYQIGSAAAAGVAGLLTAEREQIDMLKRKLRPRGLGTVDLAVWR